MLRTLTAILFVGLVCVFAAGCNEEVTVTYLANTTSTDGVTIAYSVYGSGDVTIVFVHGWSCDSRYWYRQIPYFASKYRVVTIDLAGHGNSGTDRETYTMKAFGQDVVAVLEAIDAHNVILAGHSMGGGVILEAATIAPDRIIGLIGVDTLQDMGRTWSDEEKKQFFTPLASDFKKNTEGFARSMFPKTADQRLVDAVARDMSSAAPSIALSALSQYIELVDEELVKHIDMPIVCVNADLWPTNVERNKQLVPTYKLALMKGYGHFIMLEAPDEFNRLCEEMVAYIRVVTHENSNVVLQGVKNQ